jgi:hypothetical protein
LGGAIAALTGSANGTFGGLTLGAEAAIEMTCLPPFSRQERVIAAEFRAELAWFEDTWVSATPVTRQFLSSYTALRPRKEVQEDRSVVVSKAISIARSLQENPSDIARWGSAGVFWIEVRRMYKNRGRGKSGNQLDMPRGARVFFGFACGAVAPNTIFGSVELRFLGSSAVERTVKFGDNQMDKINLPIPGEEGPEAYDNSIVVFRRTGPRQFAVTLSGLRESRRLLSASTNARLAFRMSSMRQYGFL